MNDMTNHGISLIMTTVGTRIHSATPAALTRACELDLLCLLTGKETNETQVAVESPIGLRPHGLVITTRQLTLCLAEEEGDILDTVPPSRRTRSGQDLLTAQEIRDRYSSALGRVVGADTGAQPGPEGPSIGKTCQR